MKNWVGPGKGFKASHSFSIQLKVLVPSFQKVLYDVSVGTRCSIKRLTLKVFLYLEGTANLPVMSGKGFKAGTMMSIHFQFR